MATRGRKKLYDQLAMVWMPAGTFERIEATGEARSEFVRSATLAELDKREAMATRSTGSEARNKAGAGEADSVDRQRIGAHRFACALTCKPESD